MKLTSRFTILVLLATVCFATTVTRVTSAHDDASIRASETPTPSPKVNPAPKPTSIPVATPSPTPATVQTVADLQSTIRQRLFSPEVRRGRIGIKIASLNSGKILFENDADKYFMPASNMKNFTVATAIERLTPDFRFVTSVRAAALPDADGTLKGDLVVIGGGDISISTAFSNSDYYKGIDDLAEKIGNAGVKKIEGDIVGDESYFKGFRIPDTWEWDDLQSYYGAEISALPLNDNAVDISVMPGSRGNQCIARISPMNQIMRIVNRCVTGQSGTKRNLRVFKQIDQNVVEVSGTMPTGDNTYQASITITRPAELFVAILKERLQKRGITVTGRSRTLANGERAFPFSNGASISIEVTKLESPPLSLIAAKTMKPSQNMYTETILWTLGEEVGRKNGGSGNSSNLGLSVVKGFLKQIGVPDDGIVQWDGSGLSRHNLITPSAVVTLYTYMAKQSKYSQAWRDSLTIGGVDGTLRNRFKGTAAQGNMRGKTGTIDQVSALSGYVTTAGGEQLVVSLVVNGVPTPGARVALIDEIVVKLANFNGKIDQ
ncbi:MAG: D-alanyl-D-alanine carboxypeptidase/D-alanyl-D-alanine-endopeptidase [Acidobacteria bacterium]|nr:D-alanyl-D-alanine carboxypeptidase/D-alanyl-D-alanine-endopeptidase [Acidobacteriota bacterium]